MILILKDYLKKNIMKKLLNKNKISPKLDRRIIDKDKRGKRFARIMTVLTVGIIFAIAMCI